MNRLTTTGFEPRFDLDYNRRGLPGERYVEAIREAIYRDRIEVKTDYGMTQTGNVYVEFEQRSKVDGWVPSGIATSESELWAFASPSGKGALVVDAAILKAVARELWAGSSVRSGVLLCRADPERSFQHERLAVGCCPNSTSETNPTHGVKVPVKRLMDTAWSTALGEVA